MAQATAAVAADGVEISFAQARHPNEAVPVVCLSVVGSDFEGIVLIL
jgi:hypothetical protein